ncbi:MAG: hypothetical protein HKP55_12485, partial [Gammaproteobacteria bacterium]|nr:hypothetical protein [Gammaproteobacteria bacterium]
NKSLYTERNNLGVITFQEKSRYHESGIQAKLSHGIADNWEVGLIIPVNEIRTNSTEIVGGNAINKLHKEGIGNLGLTTATTNSFNDDTYLFFEAILGLPTDTRSQQLVGGATGSVELSLTRYWGDWGIKGLVSEYFSAAKDFDDWSSNTTYKVGVSTLLAEQLYGSLLLGESDGFEVGEITLEKKLDNDKTLELTVETDINGSRDALSVSLGLTFPIL